jgi:hypothetical protein
LSYKELDESLTLSDEPFNHPDEPFNHSDEPFNQPDEPFNQPDEPFNHSDEPFNQPDEPFNQPDEPFNQPDEPFNQLDEPFIYVSTHLLFFLGWEPQPPDVTSGRRGFNIDYSFALIPGNTNPLQQARFSSASSLPLRTMTSFITTHPLS